MEPEIAIEDEELSVPNPWLKKLKIAILLSSALWLFSYFILRGVAYFYMKITGTDIAKNTPVFATDPISDIAGNLTYTGYLVVVLVTIYSITLSLRYVNASANPRYWLLVTLMVIQIIAGAIFLFLVPFISLIALFFQMGLADEIFPYSFQ